MSWLLQIINNGIIRISSFRRCFIVMLLTLCVTGATKAQLILTNSTPVTIDFTNNIQTSVGSNPSQPFAGGGFEPNPTIAGRLNSNAWAFSGWSDGPLNFGGTRVTASTDYTRGSAAAAVGTGGVYAYTGLPGTVPNPSMMFQPGGSDFEPGTVTLRVLNSGATIISQLVLSYNLFVRNDQGRSNSFNFSWSTDNNTYTAVPALDYATTQVADGLGWVQVGTSPSRSTTLSGLSIPPTTYIYLRWSCETVSGSGSRDEIGLDDITVTATYDAACSQPATQATVNSFSAVGPYQMDVNFTRGDGTGGVIMVASTSPTLSIDPVSGVIYSANANFGNGDPVGGGFIVYRGTANGINNPATVTVTGLSPNTTYYFFVFEYNVTVPCVKSPGNSGSQITAVGSATAPTDYFRSKASGNWNNTSTWEFSTTGGAPWNPSTAKPTSSASGITILNGHIVTISAAETAKLLTIASGGTLTYANQAAGGYDLDIVDATGDDFIIQGTYELYGIQPGLAPGATCRVFNNGLIKVNNNLGTTTSDDFGYSTQLYMNTGAIYEWNSLLTFSATGRTYFPNAAATDIAIFRLSQITGFSIGGGSATVINGKFEANAANSFTGAGVKVFRNGITGTGNITQLAGTGQFQITGTADLGGTGTILLNTSGMLITTTSVTTLISNKTINNPASDFTSNITVDGTLYCSTFVLSGTTVFTLSAAGILGMGSTAGISASPGVTGNVQTLLRNFNTAANYIYNSTVANQVTGNGLPNTITGYLTISNTGAASNNTVTLTTTNTIVNTLNLANGLFEAGTGQFLRIAATGTVNGTGGNQGQSAAAGTIFFTTNGTINPGAALSLTNVLIKGGVDMGSGNTTIKGTLTIGQGGFVNAGRAPTYSSSPASTLLYDLAPGPYNYTVGAEWYDNTFGTSPGVPHNVTLAASTNLDMGSTLFPREMRGNLTINNGCTFALSSGFGGDLYIKGNWTRTATGIFNPRTRAVKFNGTSADQTVTVTGGGTETFAYLIVDKTAGQSLVHAAAPNATNITVNGFGGNNTFQLINGNLDLNRQTFNFTSWFNSNQNNIGIDGTAGNLPRNINSTGGAGTFAVLNSDPATHNITINRLTGNASLLVLGNTVTLTTGALAGGFGGIDFGNNYTTINGTLQINARGFVVGYAPTYGTNSFLIYNSAGTFDRNVEWGALSGAGYPYNVTVQGGTNIRLNTPAANGDADRAIAGSLSITNTSSLLLSTTSAYKLTVAGNVTLDGTLTLPTAFGGDLYIGGNWNRSSTGVFTPNDRAVFFNGSGNSTITANNGQLFPYLYLTKSALANTLTLIDSISISKEFAVSTGTFDLAGKNATLLSNASGTASFGKVGAFGDVSYSAGGRFVVERYIPVGTLGGQHIKSWQLLAVPGNGGQTVNAAWQEGATTVNADTKPGYGTQITSNISPLPSLFDVLSAGGPSMKTYNPATALWNGIPNTTGTTLYNKKGYFLFVRGDRSVTAFSGANSSPKVTTLRSTGKLFVPGSNPAPSTTVLAGKFESIGNPYASAIDFLNITKPADPAVDDAFYVWDPLLPGSYNLGGFQTISSTNGYLPNPGSTNYPAAVPYTKIQSGQAFMVHATGAGGTVSFSENAKIAGSVMIYRPSSNLPTGRQFLRTALYTAAGEDGKMADANVLAFDNSFSNSYESKDALKIMNAGENFGIIIGDKTVSIEARKPVMRSDTIWYTLSNLRRQNYQFRFGPENMAGSGIRAVLIDRFLQQQYPISLDDSTYVDFCITGNAGSADANRFILVFTKMRVPVRGIFNLPLAKAAAPVKTNLPGAGIRVYPNPAVDKILHISFNGQPAGKYTIQLISTGGQLAYTQSLDVEGDNVSKAIKVAGVSAGFYRLVIFGGDGTKTEIPVVL